MIRRNSAFSTVRCDGARDGLVFAANLRHGREVVDEVGLSKSKPVSSPASGDGVARCQDDEFKPLDEEEKRMYQRIKAKLNYLAHDRLDLKYATFLSGKCCFVASHWRYESGEASWTILEESTLFTITGLKNSCATRMLTGLRIRLLGGRRVEVS